MQPVQGAAQIGEVVLVGGAVADVVDEPAEPGDLVGDLGVGAAADNPTLARPARPG